MTSNGKYFGGDWRTQQRFFYFSLYIIANYFILIDHEDLQSFSLPHRNLEPALWSQWWHKCWTSMKAEPAICVASSQAGMRQFPTGTLEWNSMGIWIVLFQRLSIIVGEYLTHLILLSCFLKRHTWVESVLMTRSKCLLPQVLINWPLCFSVPITTSRADCQQAQTCQDLTTYLPAPHSRCRCCHAPLQRCWLARTCLRHAPRSAPPGSNCCRTQRRWQSQTTLRTSSFCNIHQDWWCIASVGGTRWSLSGSADSFRQQGCSIAAAAAAGCCCGCDAW